jgi:hypothetical protein
MIHVFGDGFRDMYTEGTYNPVKNRLLINNVCHFEGGASNVANNIQVLINEDPYRPYHLDAILQRGLYNRYMCDNKMMFESFKYEGSTLQSDAIFKDIKISDHSTIVISTYGFGYFDDVYVVNYFKSLLDQKHGLIIIIDAKYRDVPDWFFRSARKNTLIWRCTGEEYDTEWAKNFDIVVHTNHDKGIHIYISDTDSPLSDMWCAVPKIEPVNTCGAGDTFTATLAWYLDSNMDLDSRHGLCMKAIPLCIAAAQDVCMQPYTNVPRPEIIERITNWQN